jgi:hypothetical protein
MLDVDEIVENLIETDGIHAFVFVCEAADKYLPIIEFLTVALENGITVRVTQIDKRVTQKIDETHKALKREDRIIWALRFYKKALAEQLLWMVANEPEYFKKRFKSKPAPEQTGLKRQVQKLSDVDITPFQEYDPEDPTLMDSPYSGFVVIDTINERIGHFLDLTNKLGQNDPANPVNTIQFNRQSFGEIISLLRRGEIEMRHSHFPGGIQMTQTPEGPYDLKDKEGPVETIIEFPDGWRWFNLHRNHSPMRDDRAAPSDIAITGHCANNASRLGKTAFELAQHLGNNVYKHQAFFVQHDDGRLGEMKGRKNQKPSPRLEKYIFELLRLEPSITGVGAPTSWNSAADFALADLTKPHLEILKHERPELFQHIRHADAGNE